MKAVFLDYRSIDSGDLNKASLLAATDNWQWYDATADKEIAKHIADAEVVVTNKVPLNKDLLQQTSSLKLICIAATGTDKIELKAARRLGIQVSNVTGYATPSVVQHVFSLILALNTKLLQYHQDVRQGDWQAQENFCLLNHPITELADKTIGVLGYGELGKSVAKIAQAFGMQVLVSARPGSDSVIAGRLPLEELLSQVDVLSIHVPLAENTRHLIGKKELALMKPEALLINTARGGIVDEQALADALRSGQLGGAGIDVLAEEPPGADSPLLVAGIPNLIVTPHTAWASRESRQRLLDEIALNIRAYVNGDERNCVNC